MPAVSDVNSNHTVEKDEFAAFILHMASVDLRSRQDLADGAAGCNAGDVDRDIRRAVGI